MKKTKHFEGHVQRNFKQLYLKLLHLCFSLFTDLMRSGSKPDPSIVEGDDKLSFVQLHVDLPASKQHQRIDGHHAAVSDEDAARLHLLVVDQVGAGVVANLRDKEESFDLSSHSPFNIKTGSFLLYLTV